MHMNIDSIVNDVINLPQNFYGRGNASIYTLLQESGYFEFHDQLTEEAIHNALRNQPELAGDWLGFSEAKRTSSGWFLRRGGAKGYEVGHYPDHEPVDYSDELSACAAFIKREVEEIRTDGCRA
jgi:hypothetical protein